MRGTHKVLVQNNRVQYKFDISRNITILKGDSATGKTTLIDLIAEHMRDGEKSGVNLSCDKKCVVLTSNLWEKQLEEISDSIVFIDEDNEFVFSREFASLIKRTDNYYVLALRQGLSLLPYSVDEIYRVRNTTKGYGRIKRLYSQFERLYEMNQENATVSLPELVITEDSNAGYTFFREYFGEYDIPCISAKGKSNIPRKIVESDAKSIMVIADGAAFGSEIEKVLTLRKKKEITVFLPESFEWLILKSGIVKAVDLDSMLQHPENYIESKDYFSWEQFFTSYLVEATKGTYLQYSKNKLNEVYLQPKEKQAVAGLNINERK